jgi:hypothetical protein
MYPNVDESKEAYLARIRDKFTNEELILELYRLQNFWQKNYSDTEKFIKENYISNELHDSIQKRFWEKINQLENDKKALEAKLNSPNRINDRSVSEYLDFFFGEIDQSLLELKLKPQIKTSLNEIIQRHKKEKYKTSPIAMVEEILQIISNFSNK